MTGYNSLQVVENETKEKGEIQLIASKCARAKTEQGLKDTFPGELQARNKYTYYASAAKEAGYEQMPALYLGTTGQEKEHTKI